MTAFAHVIAGGTRFHVRPHLALSAPANGGTGRRLARLLSGRDVSTELHLTAMAGGPRELDTNADVAALAERIVADRGARILFMPVALCDFEGAVLEGGAPTPSGPGAPRLRTGDGPQTLALTPAPKVISAV